MIDTDRLLREFDLIALAERDTELKKQRAYHVGPCPFCGGRDRFQLKTVGAITKWYCRGCGLDRYHDAIDYMQRRHQVDFVEACRMMAAGSLDDYETDPDRLSEIERGRQERAERERAERQEKMAAFSDRMVAEEHHARMVEANYKWWEGQGVPRAAADWWRLGYTAERAFHHAGELLTRPAYIIPKYDFNWRMTNADYRLIDPPEGAGKYRSEPGLPAAVFLSRPDRSEFPDEVLIVEGSKKAMVTTIRSGQAGDPPMVIGVPGKTSWCGIAERVRDCGRAWVIMDPDARPEADRLAGLIGKAARVISLPFKIDDGLMYHGFAWSDLRRLMRWAT